MTKEPKTGLELLREQFPPHMISKLPKPTKAQTDAVRADFKKGIRCEVCGGWHHPKVVHLDYVGHAALTDRLLNCDPEWTWEPVAFGQDGLPVRDANGGLWIRLTVCGVTRLGYGDADGKQGGNAVKEAIGDALRNAAMRFGAALDLWHKGDLHVDDDDKPEPKPEQSPEPKPEPEAPRDPMAIRDGLLAAVDKCTTHDAIRLLNSGHKYNEALRWLDDNDPPKASEVRAKAVKRETDLENAEMA